MATQVRIKQVIDGAGSIVDASVSTRLLDAAERGRERIGWVAATGQPLLEYRKQPLNTDTGDLLLDLVPQDEVAIDADESPTWYGISLTTAYGHAEYVVQVPVSATPVDLMTLAGLAAMSGASMLYGRLLSEDERAGFDAVKTAIDASNPPATMADVASGGHDIYDGDALMPEQPGLAFDDATLTDDAAGGKTRVSGLKGDTGATGSQGDPGATGATGPKGDPGEAGPQGDQGDQGDPGAGTQFKGTDTWANIDALSDQIQGDTWVLTDATGAPDDLEGGSAETGDRVTWNGTAWDNVGAGEAGPPGQDGADGADGAAGVDGTPGADGQSAYELAVAEGFVGTEQEWLDSLQGDDGADGDTGDPGAPGADGVDGAPGADGPPGPTAVSADDDNQAIISANDSLIYVPKSGPDIPNDGEKYIGKDGDWALLNWTPYAQSLGFFAFAAPGKSFVPGDIVTLIELTDPQPEPPEFATWERGIVDEVQPSAAYALPDNINALPRTDGSGLRSAYIVNAFGEALAQKYVVKDNSADVIGPINWKLTGLQFSGSIGSANQLAMRWSICADDGAGNPDLSNELFPATGFDWSTLTPNGDYNQEVYVSGTEADFAFNNGDTIWLVLYYESNPDVSMKCLEYISSDEDQYCYFEDQYCISPPEDGSYVYTTNNGGIWLTQGDKRYARVGLLLERTTTNNPPSAIFGVCLEPITDSQQGAVTALGAYIGNTTGAQVGETWELNDQLYINVDNASQYFGKATRVPPEDPLDIIPIGQVIDVDTTNGHVIITCAVTALRGFYMTPGIYDPRSRYRDIFNLDNIDLGTLSSSRINWDSDTFPASLLLKPRVIDLQAGTTWDFTPDGKVHDFFPGDEGALTAWTITEGTDPELYEQASRVDLHPPSSNGPWTFPVDPTWIALNGFEAPSLDVGDDPVSVFVRILQGGEVQISYLDSTDPDAVGGGGGDLVDDLTPQLGGDLDVNGQKIISVSDGDIVIEPDGTGTIVLGGSGGGNVGIGTDNPLNKLHVVGNNATTGSDFIALFQEPGITPESAVDVGDHADKAIMVQGAGGAYLLGRDITNDIEFAIGTSITGVVFSGSSTANDFELRVNNLTGVTLKASNQRLGVGTDTPDSRLHVHGKIDVDTIILATGADLTEFIAMGIESGYALITAGYYGVGDAGLIFKTSDSVEAEVMRIMAGGDVGIGTTSPQNKLDINGAQVIGSGYAGVETAPTDGLLVEGDVESGSGLGLHGVAAPAQAAHIANPTDLASCITAISAINAALEGIGVTATS